MLHIRTLGEGHPVVLIHGLLGMGDNLLALAKQLSEHYQVLLIDLPYHGKSPWQGGFSHSQQAQSIVSCLEQLGIEKFSLVGHSLGGKIAMQIALLHPSMVEAIVVADIAPVHYQQHRHRGVFTGLRAVNLQALNKRSEADAEMAEYIEEPGVRQFLLKNLYKGEDGQFRWRADIKSLEQHYHEIAQGPQLDSRYSGPCLFIKGQNSDYITADHQQAMRGYFPAFSFKMIANTGHWLHAEKPLIFNALVVRFLAQSSA
ncbi:Esterase YbfF [Sinobacterium norvegicum]|uniref:Esterase YbfF n=2 Tax=Sinobacterium norvegicum TaxID=1641715 RepID=A0ABN8EGJ5_9GAMM|nr:Esterase YbfF [Sinobacterium norvegicum]